SDRTLVGEALGDKRPSSKTKLRKPGRGVPHPPARSLALAGAQGQKPDPAVGVAVRDLLVKVAEQTRTAKPEDADKITKQLADELLAKLKGKSHFELAWAAFESAVNEPNPTSHTIRLHDYLVHSQQPQPQYVETLVLRRLANLVGQTPVNWPMRTVRRLLEVVRLGERAAAAPRLFPWAPDALEEAAQLRHDGEVLFWSRGYASGDEADELLKKAENAYTVLLSQQVAIRAAQATVDQAFAVLPRYVRYLESVARYEPTWRAAAQTAQDLYAVLRLPAEVSRTDFRAKLADAQQKTQHLRVLLDDLLRPFDAENQARLIAQSRQADAGPGVVSEIDGLLSTPLLKAEDRAALWKAGRELAKRLHEATVQ